MMSSYYSQEQALFTDEIDLTDPNSIDFKKRQLYSNLFFILQTQPKYIANICRCISLSEIDAFLQTVMFTIYGNQYDSREEYLLLTMFQVFFVRYQRLLSW